MKVIRTHSKNKDFIHLVQKLDEYLKITDGDEHEFYNQFNNINPLKHVVLVYLKGTPIGCGAFKKFDNDTIEIKRMYVSPKKRREGVAKKIISHLEVWAKELGYNNCVLETGKRQFEAVNFYKKCNYKQIQNYGQYQKMENSICFKKSV